MMKKFARGASNEQGIMRLATVLWVILAGALLAACSRGGGLSALPAAGTPGAARPDAGGFKTLYSFAFPPDAELPAAGMVALSGTLYGTTQSGGKGGSGAVFATSTAGKERVVYGLGTGGGADGVFPAAGLVVLGGKLYGTALSGGTHGFGAGLQGRHIGQRESRLQFRWR